MCPGYCKPQPELAYDELFKLAGRVRIFLEPLWVKAHQSWGDEPLPNPPSKYMCRYSAIFLKEVLTAAGFMEVEIQLGRPATRKLNGTEQGKFGYCDIKGCWHDHAWIVHKDTIIDITADQYGGASVVVEKRGNFSYHPNISEIEAADDISKLRKRVEEWLDLWRNHKSTV